MTQQPRELTPAEQVAAEIDARAVNITRKFQMAVESALDQCAHVNTGGALVGFDFSNGRGDKLAKAAGAYRDFAEAEAARRPKQPNIYLPPRAPIPVAVSPAPAADQSDSPPSTSVPHDGP